MSDDTIDWEQLYRDEFTPWDTKQPDSHLVSLVADYPIPVCRALDLGCGTGTNAIWLANQGFTVTATDLSETALKLARAKSGAHTCVFKHSDFLTAPLPDTDFSFVFDLGCFHGMGTSDERTRFACNVAACLDAGGLWFCISGNADSPPVGPPQLTARDIVNAVEPFFEIILLQDALMDALSDEDREALGLTSDLRPRAWTCLMRKRCNDEV
ncbi:MAG: class I SAM-dependent methyltransferase [Deltaproteobacteria bacterium]|nr:class I SAM-dependent methyltransferase [Deltaproteobacteria bacterium]